MSISIVPERICSVQYRYRRTRTMGPTEASVMGARLICMHLSTTSQPSCTALVSTEYHICPCKSTGTLDSEGMTTSNMTDRETYATGWGIQVRHPRHRTPLQSLVLVQPCSTPITTRWAMHQAPRAQVRSPSPVLNMSLAHNRVSNL